MNRWLIRGLCSLSCFLSLPATAQQQDGLFWLGRVMSAARELNYSGTFVYRNGAQAETSRITHLVEGGKEFERLEVLDGSPREVIRNNEEVKCYLPDSRTLIIEKRSQHSSFPVILPASLAGLAEYYFIRKGPPGRVAERDSQTILLEPKDDLRYGHQFWIDINSGLLLKAGMLNERGETVETFAFTQLQVGGFVDREALKSRFGAQSSGWQVHNMQATETRGRDDAWLFRVQLPGFRKLAGMKRTAAHTGNGESAHMVFSDGLAAISVFIEALPDKPELGAMGMTSLGAINVYQRAVGDQLIVVMGEVPRATLKKFGDGIEPRKK